MALPLDGITVVELAEAVTAPLASMMFADMGADVVKVEKPGIGDGLREFEPQREGVSAYYFWVNRDKRCLSLVLKSNRGRDLFLDLAADADIVVENFKPGVVDRLGVGYSDVKEHNEDVIYGHVSGYGQTGPYSDRKATDHTMQAEGGVMSVTGYPDKPAKVGLVYTDIVTGLYTAFLLFSALRYRDKTGEGQEIDLSMWDVQVFSLGLHAYRYLVDGTVSERMGMKHPAVVPYQSYETADGEYVNLLVGTEKQWHMFGQDVIDRPDIYADPRFESNAKRVANRDVLEPMLEAEIRTYSSEELINALVKAGIPAAPVNSIDEVLDHPQTAHRNLVTTMDHSKLGPASALGIPEKMGRFDAKSGDRHHSMANTRERS